MSWKKLLILLTQKSSLNYCKNKRNAQKTGEEKQEEKLKRGW